MNVDLILFIVAAVLFAIAFLKLGGDRFDLIAAGLFAWVLTNIV
jgi:hypothetical protein